jgi:hypothetical protein
MVVLARIKEKDPTSIPLLEAERGFKTPLPW